MSDLVGNPENLFSHNEAHILYILKLGSMGSNNVGVLAFMKLAEDLCSSLIIFFMK